MKEVDIFVKRLSKIGINITLFSSYPWIYFNTINNKRVLEYFQSEHGFVLGLVQLRGEDKFNFSDITEIFKLLKKYK